MHVTVRFLPEGRSVRVVRGATLLDAVCSAGLPLARACGAEGLCGRCGVEVVEGLDALPAEDAGEHECKRRNRVDARVRLACRVRLSADATVRARYW